MADQLYQMIHKQVLEYINQGNIEEVRRILGLGQIIDVDIDKRDENGMTLLMQASYKGHVEICELLVEKGADVNCNHHEHKYTPLMFACLSGSLGAAKFLLEAGAEKRATNNIGRTASQLGAFTGRHECVSLINNFVSKKDLECCTKTQDEETSPKLDPQLLNDVQKYILIHNLSPVKITLHIQENETLLENYKSVVDVLKLKCDAYVKDHDDVNEVLAMKLHYQASVLDHCGRWHRGILGQNGIDGFLKYLIRGRPRDGFPLGTEDFIRQTIREFSFQESTVFRQLVTSIAPVAKGNDPTAFTCLSQVINGIQSIEHENICATCSQGKAEKRCSACKKVVYCDAACQKLHWFTHKRQCKSVAKETKETTTPS